MKNYKVIGWKVWYGDESVVTSRESSWEQAPDQDVQVVMLYFDWKDSQGRPRRQIFSGCDYYFCDGNWTVPSNWADSFTDFSVVKGICKYGKWMKTEEEYEVVRQKAFNDYEF